jgi:hypothetical protein
MRGTNGRNESKAERQKISSRNDEESSKKAEQGDEQHQGKDLRDERQDQ